MTYIVTLPCVDILDKACIDVCPVDCIYIDEGVDRMVFIAPDECIDCAACIPECPVGAIYADTDLPDEEMEWLERNEIEAVDLPLAEGDSPVLADS